MAGEHPVSDVNEITRRVIGCAFSVRRVLGAGFLEKVYENALTHELRKAGLQVEQQKRLAVLYDGIVVGEYVGDLVVATQVLVEIKAARTVDPSHHAQCLNYLAATGLPVCLLLNFGARVEIKRFAGPNAPRLDSPIESPCPSELSVASSPPLTAAGTQMTWSEVAELGDV